MKNYAEVIGKGILVTFSFSILSFLLGYAFRIFLSKSLPIDEFGLFYSVMAFVALGGILTEFGAFDSLVKHIAELNAKRDYRGIKSAVVMIFFWRLILSLIVYGSVFVLADYFELAYFKTAGAAIVLQLVLIENIINMGVYTYIFQGLQHFKFFASMEFVRVSVFFATTYLLIGNGVAGVAMANLITTIIMGMLFTAILFWQFPFFLREPFVLDKQLFWKILKFGGILWIGSLAALISRVDILALTTFRTLEEVGLYSTAMPTAALLLIFVSPVVNVLYPSISALWEENKPDAVAKGMATMLRLLFAFMLPFSLIFIAFSGDILTTVFGATFTRASPALSILALSMIPTAMASLFLTTLKAIGHPGRNTMIALLVLAINFLLNWFLVPPYGIEGAAAATLISTCLMVALGAYFLNQKMPFVVEKKKAVLTLAGGLGMLLIMLWAKSAVAMNNAVIEAVLISAAGGLFYATWIIYSRVITKHDFRSFLTANIAMPAQLKNAILRILKD
ncbi:MAG: flippase [Candidatus Aenigmarchaeota archaeon]|nr:flippase [Candidatus Aenigmarchaeota archaeon]